MTIQVSRTHEHAVISLELVVVGLDCSLVSLLKPAQLSLTSRQALDELRVFFLLSRPSFSLQLHLLLPCLQEAVTLLML